MWRLASIPFLIQAFGMLIDEGIHRRRGLPAWERWGHPLDTLTVLACYGILLAPPARHALAWYCALAVFSCLFITKDEWVHARQCGGGESWLHAVLFTLHPILLAIAGAWRFAPVSFGETPGIGDGVGVAGPGNALVTLGSGTGSGSGHAFFGGFLIVQAALTAVFLGYQILYWNGPWNTPAARASRTSSTAR